jgi:hypothetical protein
MLYPHSAKAVEDPKRLVSLIWLRLSHDPP